MIDSVGIYSISFRPKHLDTFIDWAAGQLVQSVDLQAGSRGYDFCHTSPSSLAISAKQLAAKGIQVELLTSELDIGKLDEANVSNFSSDLTLYRSEIERFQAKGLRIFADHPGTATWSKGLIQLAQAWPTISFAIELHSAWWMTVPIVEELRGMMMLTHNVEFLLDYEKLVQHAPTQAATLLRMLMPFSRMVHLGFPPVDQARVGLVRRLARASQHYVVHLEHLGANRGYETISDHFNTFRQTTLGIQIEVSRGSQIQIAEPRSDGQGTECTYLQNW